MYALPSWPLLYSACGLECPVGSTAERLQLSEATLD